MLGRMHGFFTSYPATETLKTNPHLEIKDHGVIDHQRHTFPLYDAIFGLQGALHLSCLFGLQGLVPKSIFMQMLRVQDLRSNK